MSAPIDWRPGMRALCVNAGESVLRNGTLYFVTAVHASVNVTYLSLSSDKQPDWNADRFVPVVPAGDRPHRGPSTLEAHDDFWKDAE